MSKKIARPIRVKHRSKPPIFDMKPKGMIISCPFCEQPHPISIQEVAACGTVLRVEAVQEMWKNTTCALCGENDGERMVQIGDQYRHTHQCVDGKKILLIPPKPRLSARLAHKMPRGFHIFCYKRFGKVPAKFTNSVGKVGYTWDKP